MVHHTTLGASLFGDLQVVGIGEDGLIQVAVPLQQPPLDLKKKWVILLEDGLGPGDGHLADGSDLIVCAYLFHMGVCDGIGVVDKDILVVISFDAQGGKGIHQRPKILGGGRGQERLD